MSKLKIFLMTKNEEMLIEKWIRYHGDLFGYENLHIIDGSDQQSVLDIYTKYEKVGVNIHHTDANLNELEGVINELMHKHKGVDNFLIKMDTDEFLVHGNLNGLSGFLYWFCARFRRFSAWVPKFLIRRLDVRNDSFGRFFSSLPVTGKRYEAATMFCSVPKVGYVEDPLEEITSFKVFDNALGKSFYHSKSFRSTDLGGHLGTTKDNKGFIKTPLAIMHYHGVSLENSVRSAKQVILSHGYIDSSDDDLTAIGKMLELEKQTGYTSCHKVRLYLSYLQAKQKGEDASIADRSFDIIFNESKESTETHEITFLQRYMRKYLTS